MSSPRLAERRLPVELHYSGVSRTGLFSKAIRLTCPYEDATMARHNALFYSRSMARAHTHTHAVVWIPSVSIR